MELDYARIAKTGFPTPIARVYLFDGSDDALKQEAVARLTQPLLDPGFVDFDRDERDASPGATEGQTVSDILASAAAAPFLSERRVTIVTNAHRLGKADQESLAAALGTLCERSCLVLVAGAPEYDAGKVKAKSAVGTKLANAVAKMGTVVHCNAPEAADLKSRAVALLKERGKSIDPDALEVLVQRAVSAAAARGGGGKSGDLHVLLNEINKASAYVGDRKTIARADAAAVGIRGAEENIFTLLDCVGRREAKRALSEVDEMLRAGDKPDAVAARTFVMLARHLRMLWGAKFLAEHKVRGASGDLPEEVRSALSSEMTGLAMRQSFLLRSLQEQARGWTYEALRTGLTRVLVSDLAMKGIPPIEEFSDAVAPGDDPAANLRLLVVSLCRG